MLGYKIYNYQLHAYSVARDQFYARPWGAFEDEFSFWTDCRTGYTESGAWFRNRTSSEE